MKQVFCDECGGEITHQVCGELLVETSGRSNMAGIEATITVQGADLCVWCLTHLLRVNLKRLICKED